MNPRWLRLWIVGLLPGVAAFAAVGDGAGPRVVVDHEEHRFDPIDVGETGRHAFLFSNAGNGPLELAQGKFTCGCCTCVCAVRLPQGAIAPGTSGEVVLEWMSKLYVGPFRQTATIRTNDPDRPEVTLLVAGRFKGPVGVVPSQLRLSHVPEGRPAAAEVHLYNYLDEPLELVGWALADPQNTQHFEVTWQRVPDEQARRDAEARQGYLLRITIRPGLPPGPFRERIVLKTSVEAVPRVELPVEGLVAGDVSIAGFGWNAQSGVLSLGRVKRAAGAERTLIVIARGPHAKDVKIEPAAVTPDYLKVEVGPTTYSAESGVGQARVKIRIPPGAPPAIHFGGDQGEPGRVTLKTHHPELPEIDIQVRFAVEE